MNHAGIVCIEKYKSVWAIEVRKLKSYAGVSICVIKEIPPKKSNFPEIIVWVFSRSHGVLYKKWVVEAIARYYNVYRYLCEQSARWKENIFTSPTGIS